MELFEEIDSIKKDLPKVKSVSKEVDKIQLNVYQKISIVIFLICVFLGIFFGNLFPSCGASYEVYSNYCETTEFNVSLMIGIWFISFIVCLLFFALGHIIELLSSIDKHLSKK